MKNKKIAKIALVLTIITISYYFFSCDDSGLNPEGPGRINVQVISLQPLNKDIDGFYELWVAFDSTSSHRYVSLGKFNINENGIPVDSFNQAKTFTLPDTTLANDLPYMRYGLLTLEPYGDLSISPSDQRLLAAPFITSGDTIKSTMTLGDDNALGSTGRTILGGDRGVYMIYSITDNPQYCSKGVWFCFEDGSTGFPQGIDLSGNVGWVFEGWMREKTTGAIYSIGRFDSPYHADSDGPGPCSAGGTPFDVPGQEFIDTSCTNVGSFVSGNYEVFMTLEPRSETTGINNPFLKLYFQDNIIPTVGCKRHDNLFNKKNFGGYPELILRITTK
jgi:hypothetical protein